MVFFTNIPYSSILFVLGSCDGGGLSAGCHTDGESRRCVG